MMIVKKDPPQQANVSVSWSPPFYPVSDDVSLLEAWGRKMCRRQLCGKSCTQGRPVAHLFWWVEEWRAHPSTEGWFRCWDRTRGNGCGRCRCDWRKMVIYPDRNPGERLRPFLGTWGMISPPRLRCRLCQKDLQLTLRKRQQRPRTQQASGAEYMRLKQPLLQGKW